MLDQSQVQRIRPQMRVVSSNEKEFAIVDRVEGNELKLTKDAQGQHHYIPLDWVRSIDDKVHIDRPEDQAMRQWKTKTS